MKDNAKKVTIIKLYNSGKYYNPTTKKYLTLDQVNLLLNSREKIIVMHNKTKKQIAINF